MKIAERRAAVIEEPPTPEVSEEEEDDEEESEEEESEEEELEEVEDEEELPEITREMINDINNALRGQPSNEVLTERFRIRLTRKDMNTLQGLNWLNDEVRIVRGGCCALKTW